jgi:DNA repair photolyase
MNNPLPGSPTPALRTRGVAENPTNRFERLAYAADLDFLEDEHDSGAAPDVPPTVYLRDPSKQPLSFNDSPDLPFRASLNPYRGCTHGCVYCYARPTHEYLGFSAGLDFETRVLVKEELPALLRKALSSPRWQPQVVAVSGVTDAYQPIDRKTRLTRRCLEVFAEFRNPVAIVTKSSLVVRDIDVLAELARHDAARVYISITTLDRALHRVMEPRAAAPSQRLAAIEALSGAGIPVGVMVAPVIPGLTDHEAPAIVEAAARAGARSARHLMLRLPYGNKQLFEAWLGRHFPERADKVMNRVRAMRGGKLNDARFHQRMRGSGFFADQTHEIFALACRRAGLSEDMPEVSAAAFRRPPDPQLSLFGAES